MLEAQQRVILEQGDSWTHALQADAGALQARRVVKQVIEREANGAPAAATIPVQAPIPERVGA